MGKRQKWFGMLVVVLTVCLTGCAGLFGAGLDLGLSAIPGAKTSEIKEMFRKDKFVLDKKSPIAVIFQAPMLNTMNRFKQKEELEKVLRMQGFGTYEVVDAVTGATPRLRKSQYELFINVEQMWVSDDDRERQVVLTVTIRDYKKPKSVLAQYCAEFSEQIGRFSGYNQMETAAELVVCILQMLYVV